MPRKLRAIDAAGSVAPKLDAPPGLEAWCFAIRDQAFALMEWPAPRPCLPARLTPAEAEVAELMLAGLSNEEIAKRRGSAARTVANQSASIFRKVGVGSRAELFALLARNGP